MAVMLGGEKTWKQKVHGDIVVSYQWVNNEPAMVLFPKRKQSVQSGAYALCLSSAFKYMNSNGYPVVGYLIPQSAQAAQVMGLDSTTLTIRNIADAIVEGIEDLIAMPPEPQGINQAQAAYIADMKVTVNGDTISHKEVEVPAEVTQ